MRWVQVCLQVGLGMRGAKEVGPGWLEVLHGRGLGMCWAHRESGSKLGLLAWCSWACWPGPDGPKGKGPIGLVRWQWALGFSSTKKTNNKKKNKIQYNTIQ